MEAFVIDGNDLMTDVNYQISEYFRGDRSRIKAIIIMYED